MQGLVPAPLRLPVHLVDEHAAEPDRVDWFRIAATANPVSYLIEGIRSLIIDGLGRGGARPRVLRRDRARRRRDRARRPARSDEADADMSGYSLGRARRRLAGAPQDLQEPVAARCRSSSSRSSSSPRSPAACRRCTHVPASTIPAGYTAFQFVFVLLQSAAFGGVFTGLRDRARLRVRLLAAALPRGAAPQRAVARLRDRGARPLGDHGGAAHRCRAGGGMQVGGSGVDLVALFMLGADRQRRRPCSGPAGSPCASAPCRPGR